MARSIAPVGVKRKALLARRAADKIEAVEENVTLEPNGSARKTVADGREWPTGAGGGALDRRRLAPFHITARPRESLGSEG